MLKQKQSNVWTCLPMSFAMVLDVPTQGIFDHCGHDGSEIVFPGYVDPYCRRSFHIQEMIDFCFYKRKYVIQIDDQPVSSNGLGDQYSVKVADHRMASYLWHGKGVLVGSINNKPHAVAWDPMSAIVYDPNGTNYSIDKFNIRSFFLIKSM